MPAIKEVKLKQYWKKEKIQPEFFLLKKQFVKYFLNKVV